MATVNKTVSRGSKNRLVRTEAFNLVWTPTGTGSVTADNTTDPLGTTLADLITDSDAISIYQLYQEVPAAELITNRIYTFSVYLKPNTSTKSSIYMEHRSGANAVVIADVDWSITGNPSVTKATAGGSVDYSKVDIRSAANGFYRVVVTSRWVAGGSTSLRCVVQAASLLGSTQASAWAWGAQFEIGDCVTDYQAITGATDPLVADYLTIDAWRAATDADTTNINIALLRDETYQVTSNTLLFSQNSPARTTTNHRRISFASAPYDPITNIGPKIVIEYAASGTNYGIKIQQEHFITIEGIGFFVDPQSRPDSGIDRIIWIDRANDARIISCFINGERMGESDSTIDGFLDAIYIDGTDSSNKALRNSIFNTIVKGGTSNGFVRGVNIAYFWGPFAELGGAYNCAAYACSSQAGSSYGFFSSDSDFVNAPQLANCISCNSPRNDFAGKWLRFDNNISSDGSADDTTIEWSGSGTSATGFPDPGSKVGKAGASIWVNPDFNDFRLRSGSPAIDAGKDETATFNTALGVSPGGGPGNTNAFGGTARTGTWDIGPYTGSTAPTLPTFTVVTKTVGTDRTRDYSSIAAFIRSLPKSLYSANKKYVANCYPDAAFDAGETLEINFYDCLTTPAACIEITGSFVGGTRPSPQTLSGHKITFNLDLDPVTWHRSVIWCSNPNTKIESVILHNTATTASTKGPRCLELFADGCTIDAVIGVIDGNVDEPIGRPFEICGARDNLTNCLAIGSSTIGTGATQGFEVAAYSVEIQLLHCVSYNIRGGPAASSQASAGFAVRLNWIASRVSGCIAMITDTAGSGGAVDFLIAASGSISDADGEQIVLDHCISEDTTALGFGSKASQTNTVVFNSPSTRDFRLKVGSPALNAGADLSEFLGTDIAGVKRTRPFDIGIFEGVVYPPLTGSPRAHDHHRYTSLWEIVRSDGIQHLFCSCNEPVTHAGQVYKPLGQTSASARRMEGALKEQNAELLGAVVSGEIDAEDLAAGVFSEATVTERIVDWRYPWTTPYRIRQYFIDNLSFDQDSWKAELVGPTVKLDQQIGESIGTDCPYDLGDDDCQLNLNALTEINRTVSSVADARRQFSATGGAGITNSTDDYFGLGSLLWLTGNNAGLRSSVKTYTGSTRTVRLMEQTPFDIQTNDRFTIKPGCRKRLIADCKNKFNNSKNHGGRGHIPGTDKAFESPLR